MECIDNSSILVPLGKQYNTNQHQHFGMGKNTRLLLILLAASGILIFLAIILLTKDSTTSAETNQKFIVETVDRGEVISSVKASGIIESDDEIIVRSPERSIISKVYKNAGAKVEKGELLIELDKKSVQSEIDRMKNQLELKQNALDKLQLNAQSTRLSLDRTEEAKRLRITKLKSTLEQQEKMLSEGNISETRVDRTRQEVEMAETDLQTQIEKNAIRIQQMDADERGLLLQIHNQEKNLEEKQQLLGKLKVKAPADGVILAINSNEGQRVESDAMLLRMSDLSSYKVVGWVNERDASRVQTGDDVSVYVGEETLQGVVGEITPMVEDEMVHFDVHLKDKKHSGLEINKSVSLEVTGVQHNDVLRVKKHPEFENASHLYLYVLDNRNALKKEVIFGTIGNNYCEIVTGLNEGDEVLVGHIDAENGPDKFRVKNSQLN